MMRCALLFCSAVALAGAYSVQHEDVTVGGYECGEHQTARVYFPTASDKFPIVSFAHGYNNGGTDAYACYEKMNTDLAAAGYVVIVSESSSWPFECSGESKDQIRSIEWAKTSKFASIIDFSKVGLMGHSMGGGASYHNAGQADVVKAYKIGAVVALHPQTTWPLYSTSNPVVPIFFGSGSEDSVISPSDVKSAYSKTTGVPKVFSEIEGAGHDESMCDCDGWTSPGLMRHTPYAIAMFDCHLLGDHSQCSKVYGSSSASLCSGSVKMTDCEHANEPTIMRGVISPLYQSLSGAYQVQHEDVYVGGYACWQHQYARVYFPKASGKFPIVSFAHGYNNDGEEAYACYEKMNTDLAAAGYVVIVSESGLWPFECASEAEDQLRSIEWAKTSKFASIIDFSKVGLMGHSMGGGSSYHNAGQADVVKAYNIGAVVALHPQITSPLPLFWESNSLVPIFFGSGSDDGVVSPSSVKSAYSKTTGVAKAFSEIEGAVHDESMCDCAGWKSPGLMRHTPYAIAMFDCHLLGDHSQCSKVYGSSSASLCSGSVKMTDCEHANEPTEILVTV